MVSHISCLPLACRIIKCVLLLLVFAIQMSSQPILSFNRIGVNWPQVSLFVAVKCSTEIKTTLDVSNFRIKENNLDIPNFTISCPDPNAHCSFSAALVVDRSGSMGSGAPSALDGAKTGLKAFIASMQVDDEATLISFNQTAGVDVFMTNNKTLLINGVDGLNASGNTAVWDAGVMGVNEVVNNGTQPCRGEILITDGEDAASSNAVDDLISLALVNKIRVYTIGIGSGINDADLSRIAADTGGKYYKVIGSSDLVKALSEIYYLISHGYYECEIKYLAACMDGVRRNVELTLQSLSGCQGTDTKTKTYKPPKDTSTFQPINIKIQTTPVQSDSIAYVPLLLDTPLNEVFNKATFKIFFLDSCCAFESISTKGYLLDGVQINTTAITGGIQCTTTSSKIINGQGVLAMLKFKAPTSPYNIYCTLQISGWTFDAGCLKPVVYPGDIVINSPLSLITPNGGEILCKGKTATIQWLSSGIQAFDLDYSNDSGKTFHPIAHNIPGNSYQWLLSDSLPNGSYIVRVSEHGGINFDMSKSMVYMNEQAVVVRQPRDTLVCKNEWVIFTASAVGSPKPTIQWQDSNDSGKTWRNLTGETSETFQIISVPQSDNNRKFRALFANYCGDSISTNSATLRIMPEPAITIQPTDQIGCAGNDVTFSVRFDPLSLAYVQWQVAANGSSSFSDIPNMTNQDYIINNVDSSMNGNKFRAVVRNRCGTAVSAAAELIVKASSTKIVTHPLSRIVCEGDSVIFSVVAQNATRYQWQKDGIDIPAETLAVYKIINVITSQSGSYSVKVYGDCGTVVSDTAVLTIDTAPAIIQQPTTQTADENKSVTFTVNAIGTNLTFQWMKDGIPIPGATNPALTIISVKKSDEGNYNVEIKGSCGIPIISNVVQLNVIVSSVENAAIPTQPVLYQNYPNPFSQETVLGYRVAAATNVRLELYDMLGRKIATLIDEEQDAGSHTYTFNPEAFNLKLKNGVFMCVMHAEKYTLMKQIVLMK